MSVAATVAWLALSTSCLLGEACRVMGSQTMFTASIATVAACSGLILHWHEWRRDPAVRSEYGKWANAQPLYAIVLAIRFFVGSIALAARYLATWNEA